MGKMQQFKREIRSSNGRIFAFDLRNGFGAVLGGLFEKIARGKVHDQEIREIYGLEDEGDREPMHVRIAAGPQMTPSSKPGKYTALVSMHGVALYDLEFQPYCFSTLLLSQVMDQLANDPTVDTIVLDINTPGGHVTGTQEAADAVFKAAKKKTVVGIINPLCASAGYWIGSQCTRLVAVPSADIGSIGVFMCHYDCSAMLADFGVKPTFIYAGEYKTEGNAMEPLSDEARAFYQSEVDQTYDDFLTAVARGRGVSKDVVLQKFGKGRCYAAPVAKRLGMIDEVATVKLALQSVGLTMDMPEDGRRRRGDEQGPGEAAEVAPAADEASAHLDRPAHADQVVSIEGAEPITFSEARGEDGLRIVYAAGPWPAKALITPTVFEGDSQRFVRAVGDTITIAVENGAAVYTKIGVAEGGAWVCTLADGSSFSTPPTSQAQIDAEAAERQRRADILRRRIALLGA